MMKTKALLIFLLLISITCFGRPKYTIPKQDFIDQFSGSKPPWRVACINEKGEKVWLHGATNASLIIMLEGNTKKIRLLNTARYKAGMIMVRQFPPDIPGSKIDSFDIDDIQSLTIERYSGMYERPYFNFDSTRKVAQAMNDSMEAGYAARSESAIYLTPKRESKDTLLLIAGACYNINFKDGNSLKYGVIRQVTRDSIYITSSFNEAMAADHKKEYTVHQYAISDISGLSLLKSGGFGSKNIKIEDYDVVVDKLNKASRRSPYSYVANPTDGEIRLYRWLLTERGFLGITEVGGKPVWYEGE